MEETVSDEQTIRRPVTDEEGLDLGQDVLDRLQARLPAVAEQTVHAVIVEVPAYADALAGVMGDNIRSAVELALGGFLRLAGSPGGTGAGSPLAPALEGAYELGRGEARSGRSMDALLAAYRVGARQSWRQFSEAVESAMPSRTMAKFAELVFAYIDGLSAASVAGHADELATTGRVLERYRHRLTSSLLRGDPADAVAARAERAAWEPPRTLSAVVMATDQASRPATSLDDRTLRADEDLPDLEEHERDQTTVLLVADADGARRPAILSALRGSGAYVGPARPWEDVRTSYLRALRARRLGIAGPDGAAVDTDQHLAALVVSADPSALADLRAQALAPLDDVRESSTERLVETLRAWLLHQGRREEVAAALHVHPQTVRYRMNQLRDLYGDRLDDPDTVLAVTIALAGDTSPN